MTKTILVIPDAHAKPGVPNDRFDWAGQLIVALRPDVVVELGDFADMESLCSYDKGKRSFEGRRLIEDIAAAKEARQRLTQPLRQLQAKQCSTKHKVYRPRLIALCGNHEHRVSRMMEDHPELHGMYTPDVSGAVTSGWEFHDFLSPVSVEGITFCHYFTSGVMGRPISGENPATSLINKMHTSCVQGHTHILDYSRRATQANNTCTGLIAGCFFEHYEPYAGPANKMWARGLAILHNVRNGDYDFEWIGIERLKEEI